MMNSQEIPNKCHEPHDDQKTSWFRAVKDFFLWTIDCEEFAMSISQLK